jgi:hypothetical protein
MRKSLFAFLFAVLLVMGGVLNVYADADIQSGDNAVIFGSYMGPEGMTPPTFVQKVYVTGHGTLEADQYDTSTVIDQGIDVGDVVMWDTTRADGYSVTILNADAGVGGIANACVAGVMVTNCSRDTGTLTTPKGSGLNVGYMAVKGFCYAKVDTSAAATGGALIANGSTLEGSFATAPTTMSGKALSQDIGILLLDNGADGSMKVVLK